MHVTKYEVSDTKHLAQSSLPQKYMKFSILRPVSVDEQLMIIFLFSMTKLFTWSGAQIYLACLR